jgi:hypothetical protein
MTNANGPAPARPETDAAPAVPHTAPGGEPHRAVDATPAASVEAAAKPAEAPPAEPEVKEKNKIFEAVRLKARLSMAEHELDKLRAEIEQLRGAPADFQDKNMRLLA